MSNTEKEARERLSKLVEDIDPAEAMSLRDFVVEDLMPSVLDFEQWCAESVLPDKMNFEMWMSLWESDWQICPPMTEENARDFLGADEEDEVREAPVPPTVAS